jgi:HK97 gp10 family phage protein
MSTQTGLGLTVVGGEALAAKLQALGGAVRQHALVKILRAAAVPIQSRAAELAPYDPRAKHHLSESIGISTVPMSRYGSLTGTDDYQAAVAVGPTKSVFWGLFVEYGYGPGVRHARPFMRPAFDYGGAAALAIMREGLWDLLTAANQQTGIFERADAGPRWSPTSGEL